MEFHLFKKSDQSVPVMFHTTSFAFVCRQTKPPPAAAMATIHSQTNYRAKAEGIVGFCCTNKLVSYFFRIILSSNFLSQSSYGIIRKNVLIINCFNDAQPLEHVIFFAEPLPDRITNKTVLIASETVTATIFDHVIWLC